MNIKLTGRIPSKKNSRVTSRKTGMSFANKSYVAWNKAALTELIPHIPKEPINLCDIEIVFCFGDLRKTDLTNKAESVMDTLVDAKIITDDNWFVVKTLKLSARYNKGEFGCEVIINSDL